MRRKPYLPDEQADFVEVIDSVDPAAEDEDLVVYLTGLPRRADTQPVVADVSADHKFAVVSLPGVGGIDIERRVRTITDLAISDMLGAPELTPPGVARRFPSTEIPGGTRYFAPPGLRRLRLLAGMVRANRGSISKRQRALGNSSRSSRIRDAGGESCQAGPPARSRWPATPSVW